ncbi:MAG: hypothetical protein Q8939_18965 [Bacteroidota bacterium]|nr:hypothetical protein [Bacteroidota bacterium]MDP4213089.1 hypothetical protein [Bacteroidota bacterium]
MPAKTKKKYEAQITIDPDMPDYSNDPYFVKKNEEATAFLKKHGLPDELLEKLKDK